MSAGKHTQGRMTWKRRPDGSLIYVIGAPNDGPHAQGDIFISEADLRRIAACWNACEGIATKTLISFIDHDEAGEIDSVPENLAHVVPLLALRQRAIVEKVCDVIDEALTQQKLLIRPNKKVGAA